MLPYVPAPDVQTVCAQCGEVWPCEIARLRDVLATVVEALEQITEDYKVACIERGTPIKSNEAIFEAHAALAAAEVCCAAW